MIGKLFSFVLISVAIYFAIAIGLILSQWPTKLKPGPGLDFIDTLASGIATMPEPQAVAMRDGYALQTRVYEGPEAGPLVVLVHGSGWNGLQFSRLAPALAERAEVLVPDLRGHGAHPGTRGDVAYIGQFEDDLFDLIKARQAPGQKVIVLGHSSGGGLVVRMAGGAHGAVMDHAILLAPFLKYNAPTTRENSGGWAKALTRRLIGLSMLNQVGIKLLNHLTIIQFRMPQEVVDDPLGALVTDAYSFRLNTSYAPRSDYLADIAQLPDFTLLAGGEDEAFHADKYEPVMSDVSSKGRYVTVEGVNHLGIVDAPEVVEAVKAVINGL